MYTYNMRPDSVHSDFGAL